MVAKKVSKVKTKVSTVGPAEKVDRVTKRRENAIKLLDKFDAESSKVSSEIKSIDRALLSDEQKLIETMTRLKTVQDERLRRKKQLESIVILSDEYKKSVCEQFNVKIVNVDKIRK